MLRRLEDLDRLDEPAGRIGTVGRCVAQHVENACALLDGHQVPEGQAPAGQLTRSLPGLSYPLLPPWTLADAGPDGVRMDGHFTQAHVGGNNAVHGGMILCSCTTGCSAWWSPPRRFSATRTAYLHVDYRSITPIDEPLTAHGRITDIDGRKVFIAATMTAGDSTLLSEANGLMVRLLPHQP